MAKTIAAFVAGDVGTDSSGNTRFRTVTININISVRYLLNSYFTARLAGNDYVSKIV